MLNQNQEVLLPECEEYIPFELRYSISTQKFVSPVRARNGIVYDKIHLNNS
jgi:hypothetical protein